MSPIKDFELLYKPPNKENVFTSGDTVAGKVTFKLKDDTKVKGVVVKVKGEARVHWTEGTGDRRRSYSDHRRYFKDKVVLVEEGERGNDIVHRADGRTGGQREPAPGWDHMPVGVIVVVCCCSLIPEES